MSSEINRGAESEIFQIPDQQASFQLRLSDLFVVMAFFAAIALAYSLRWTTSSNFAITVVFAMLLGSFLVWRIDKRSYDWVYITLAVLCLLILFIQAAMISFGLCLSLLMYRWLPTQYSTRRFALALAMISIIASLFLINQIRPARVQHLLEARIEHPIEDLSERLEYENPEVVVERVSMADQARLSKKVQAGLTEFESFSASQSYRIHGLERIHNQAYEDFIRAVGFGVVRMSTPRFLSLPELPSITQDGVVSEENANHVEGWLNELEPYNELPISEPVIHGFHKSKTYDFVHPLTIGHVFDHKQAAGFVPHALHFPTDVPSDLDNRTWEAKYLYLVSMLKFDQPKVYQTDELPRMDELSSDDVPTRPLDEFEKIALDQLVHDEDVVVKESGNVIRMLGAIRANQSCLQCHDVQRGDLLGAFTYEFRLVTEAPSDEIKANDF